MNTLHRSWTDDTLGLSGEVTRPGDVLSLSGEIAANDDDTFPVDRFVEESWDDDGTERFSVSGSPPTLVQARRGDRVVTYAQGIVKRIAEDRLILGTPGTSWDEIVIAYRLPASVDLRPLVGRRAQVALDEQAPRGQIGSQTLQIRGQDDHVWLVAGCGRVHEEALTVEGAIVNVMVSPKDGGPMVIALPDLRHIIAPGSEKRMRIGAARYVAEFVSRDEPGGATYLIADDRLWH